MGKRPCRKAISFSSPAALILFPPLPRERRLRQIANNPHNPTSPNSTPITDYGRQIKIDALNGAGPSRLFDRIQAVHDGASQAQGDARTRAPHNLRAWR